jgi:hypothetical protein
MATQRATTVASALEAKGMERDENHHHMFRKQVGGVTTLVTRISHNSKDINDGLGRLMGKQLCLNLKEFWELIECPLSEEQWDAVVAERCEGGLNPFLVPR